MEQDNIRQIRKLGHVCLNFRRILVPFTGPHPCFAMDSLDSSHSAMPPNLIVIVMVAKPLPPYFSSALGVECHSHNFDSPLTV